MTKQQRDDLNFLHCSISALLFIVAKEHSDLVEHIFTMFERLKNELIERD